MKNKKILLALIAIVLFIAAIIIIPRAGTKKVLRFPDIVKSPDLNTKTIIGTPLDLTLNSEKLAGQDSVVIKLNGQTLEKLTSNYQSVSVPTKDLALGYHRLDISVHDGDYSKTIDMPFYVVSDINPEFKTYTTLSTINRDIDAYTQGFEISDGILYESGGQFGLSLIRKVNPANGVVLKTEKISGELFGEGLTVLNDKVYQLTWQNGICLIYDKNLQLLKQTGFKSSNGEGWGLCNDGKSLILSDGTNRLMWLNPETMVIEKSIYVYAGQNEVRYLNELEYVDGYIYANIYTTEQIAKIDATTGKVITVFELKNLDKGNPKADVLNGIAWNPSTKSFLITGKNWGKIYNMRL